MIHLAVRPFYRIIPSLFLLLCAQAGSKQQVGHRGSLGSQGRGCSWGSSTIRGPVSLLPAALLGFDTGGLRPENSSRRCKPKYRDPGIIPLPSIESSLSGYRDKRRARGRCWTGVFAQWTFSSEYQGAQKVILKVSQLHGQLGRASTSVPVVPPLSCTQPSPVLWLPK